MRRSLPPWSPIVVGFLILIAIWIVFIKLAVENQPAPVPLEEVGR